MQVLKDDVRNKILRSALTEFRHHGYQDSSMRRIAAHAGITTGNIYRYFKNKECLFDELIQPAYERFVAYIVEIKQEIDHTFSKDAADTLKYIRKVDNTVVELFRESGTEVMILLNRSGGSKYAQVKQELVQLTFRILEKVFVITKGGLSPLDEAERKVILMLAMTLMEGVCKILREHEDGDTIKLLVDELIQIYHIGIAAKISGMNRKINQQGADCGHDV